MCSWPSFYDARNSDAVELVADHSHGMVRTEVRCARCGSHLGHVFEGEDSTPTDRRYCINTISLRLVSTVVGGLRAGLYAGARWRCGFAETG
ncbi:hypothetical protein GCM10022206_76670 [Streptomyces chiangmaiensis]